MKFKKKKFLLIGFQIASLRNLKDALQYFYGYTKIISPKNLISFNRDRLNKYVSNLIKKNKEIKNSNIIVGTSENPFESIVSNCLQKNNIDYYSFLDSNVNMKIRYNNYKKLPKNILTLNSIVANELKKTINIKYKSRIIDLKMPYQKYLKEKYYKKYRKNKIIIYLTNDIGIKYEKKYALNLLKKYKDKKVYICVHPREKLIVWKKVFNKFKNLNFFQNKHFYNNLNVKNIFGISTLGLINYKFVGCNVNYFRHDVMKNNPIKEFFKKYKIKQINYESDY